MVDRDTVNHVARLARLRLDASAVARMQRDLSAMLRYVDRLRTANTTGVAPMTHPLGIEAEARVDPPGTGHALPEVIDPAPERSADGHLVVPPVFDEDA